ncbi:phosphotransferase [Streptomyces sp. NPDC059233]
MPRRPGVWSIRSCHSGADLPLELHDPAGSDHVIYRLGEDLSVRLAHHAGAIGQAAKESEWLPRLAPHLPLDIPVPLGVGEPDFDYPWPWAVSRWLDGVAATVEALADCPGPQSNWRGSSELFRYSCPRRSLPWMRTRTSPADRDRATRAGGTGSWSRRRSRCRARPPGRGRSLHEGHVLHRRTPPPGTPAAPADRQRRSRWCSRSSSRRPWARWRAITGARLVPPVRARPARNAVSSSNAQKGLAA